MSRQPWMTLEGIEVKPLYTAADLEGLEHLDYAAGLPPSVRGPYSTMYAMHPWTVRQYAGFSTAEDSNAFYRRNLAAGRKRAERGVRLGDAARDTTRITHGCEATLEKREWRSTASKI